MAVIKIKTNRYECDGCGKVQLGEMADNVFGLIGSVVEHTPNGGHGTKWFACSRKCVGAAVENALDIALNTN